MDKNVFIIRGLPGAGKSTLSKRLVDNEDHICEADHYQVDEDGNYDFQADRIHYAHNECKAKFQGLITRGVSSIVVSNTSTTVKEFQPYKKFAEKNGYRVTVLIVENRHGNKSIHDVPEESMTRMHDRFQIQLCVATETPGYGEDLR